MRQQTASCQLQQEAGAQKERRLRECRLSSVPIGWLLTALLHATGPTLIGIARSRTGFAVGSAMLKLGITQT
jgi:hypothetical protein